MLVVVVIFAALVSAQQMAPRVSAKKASDVDDDKRTITITVHAAPEIAERR